MPDDYKIKKLQEKFDKILEKYEDKPRIYPKLKDFCRNFLHSTYVNPRHYIELAKLTSKINYRCYFENGKCKEKREEMCCCSNCKNCLGHLHIKFFDCYYKEKDIEEELLFYVKKYSKATGFWRKGKGCILPREKRSSTCLGYNCNNKFSKEEQLLILCIRNCKKFPAYIDLIIDMLKDYFLYKT